MAPPLLVTDDRGLFCPKGGFWVDPWGPVERALLTHAHADHAQPVMARALLAEPGLLVAQTRLDGVRLDGLPYGERLRINDVVVSFHPSGHILGAAQIRIESDEAVWVVSGDYKLASDDTTPPFEPVPCDVFISEATFGLPLFRWEEPETIFEEISAWWQQSKAEGRACLVYVYALGKAARLLSGLAAGELVGPIYTHGAVERMLEVYRASGVLLPETNHLALLEGATLPPGALVLAPPRAQNTPWAKKLDRQGVATAFCSGWMRVRGHRRRKGVERGFVLSDHADWPGLLAAVRGTGAGQVLVTHGYGDELARFLREGGLDASTLSTPHRGEEDAGGGSGDIGDDLGTA